MHLLAVCQYLAGDGNWNYCDMSFALTPLLDLSVFASGIISTFLHVHPFGASIEYICSYLQRLDTKVTNTHDSELPPWNGVA